MIGEWVRSFIERIRGKPLNLVEIFSEYQVELEYEAVAKGRGGRVYGSRIYVYRVIPKDNPNKVTYDALERYVASLNEQHPEEHFKLVEKTFGKRKFYVLTKNNPNSNMPTVPIYFDLERQKFYIEKEATKTPKITNYIIMRTLGALGVSQSKYVSSRMVRNERD